MDTPINMKQPTDASGIEQAPGSVCLLVKILYGAKQAGYISVAVLNGEFIKWGLKQSTVGDPVYFSRQGQSILHMVVVVDDISFASNDQELLKKFKKNLRATFNVKLYGNLRTFIRWSIRLTSTGIKVDQREYIYSLLARLVISYCNSIRKPIRGNAPLRPPADFEQPIGAEDHYLYQAIIGGLSYLVTCTRPDLTFTVSALARYLHDPSYHHPSHSKRGIRYVAGKNNYVLFFAARSTDFMSMVSSVVKNWGAAVDTHRSVTGFLVSVNGSHIFWRSKIKLFLRCPPVERSTFRYQLALAKLAGCEKYSSK